MKRRKLDHARCQHYPLKVAYAHLAGGSRAHPPVGKPHFHRATAGVFTECGGVLESTIMPPAPRSPPREGAAPA